MLETSLSNFFESRGKIVEHGEGGTSIARKVPSEVDFESPFEEPRVRTQITPKPKDSELKAETRPGAAYIEYPSETPEILLLRKRLGHLSRAILNAIHEGQSIKEYLERLRFSLDYEIVRRLAEEAIKVRNIAALTELAEYNPFAVARVLEERLSDLADVNDLRLFHLYFLVRDRMSAFKEKVFRRLVSYIVLRKALGIVGTRPVRSGSYRRRVSYRPSLDFDLEATIEKSLEKVLTSELLKREDIICLERRDKRTAGVIIIDFSGSMYGFKNLLASLISALAAFTLSRTDEYSIIVFSDQPYVLKGMKEEKDIRKILSAIFEMKPLGFTNIADALKKAAEELRKSKVKSRKWAILITDGEYNRGDDPLKYANLFQKLHVIQLGGGTLGTYVCRNLAKNRGKYVKVNDIEELLRTVRSILKYPDR